MVLLRHPKNSWISGVLPGDWQSAQAKITTTDQKIVRRTQARPLFGLGFRSVGAGGPFCNKPLVNGQSPAANLLRSLGSSTIANTIASS